MNNTTPSSSEKEQRLEKLNAIKSKGENPFAYTYDRTHTIESIRSEYGHLQHGDTCEDVIKVAGRLMAKRGHGKATFGNFRDASGDLQYYGNVSQLGDALYDKLIHFDIGDIIGVEGVPFVSQRGELTIRVQNAVLLSKSLRPLPEKFHGLQDKELRYRQRYVDLIANPDVRNIFKTRSEIVKSIRDFLAEKEFMEVETPVLQSIYGGAAARPFKTHHNEMGQDLFLRIALELPLKRLIVGGFEKVFEIGRVFRNEGVSFKHNPEYTLLELYQAYADYNDVMTLTEELLSGLVMKLNGSYTLTYQGKELDFTPPFKRLRLQDALQEYAGVDMLADIDTLRKKAEEMGLDISEKPLKGHVINYLYDKAVEPHLTQPVFIIDYPWETSPLAKRHRDNPELVERFELIVDSMELANAFSELNDPIDQKARFADQKKQKEAGDQEAHETDDDFVTALEYGMAPTGGLGLGIDRIVMLLTDSDSIRDVLFFPHMKQKGSIE